MNMVSISPIVSVLQKWLSIMMFLLP